MIYFAQAVSGGPVKIGCSADVDARIHQLELHYGKPLALLGTMPGDKEEDQAIHAQFAHLRFGRTEQFRPAPDLMAFIGRPLLVGANPDAVEAMKPVPVDIRLRMDIEMYRQVKAFARSEYMTVAGWIKAVVVREMDRRDRESRR